MISAVSSALTRRLMRQLRCRASLHLAPLIGQRVADLADHRLGRAHRQELHEVDLVRVDVEGDVGEQLVIEPLALMGVAAGGSTRGSRRWYARSDGLADSLSTRSPSIRSTCSFASIR